jgi:hypothetical protein
MPQAACSGDKPLCSNGACVCSPEGPKDCPDSTHARTCTGGALITLTCAGSTPVCANGQCVQCLAGQRSCQENTAQTCSNGAWSPQSCSYGCLNGQCRPSTYGTIGVAGTITCTSTLTCPASTPCCYDGITATGTCSTTCGTQSQSSIGCDGPNDCPAGQVCCYMNNPAGYFTACYATQCPTPSMTLSILLCDPAAAVCPAGKTCTAGMTRMTPTYLCQ